MTEAEWLACANPEPMLDECWSSASWRKRRLFGCGCCWLAAHLLNPRDRAAVEAAERYADRTGTIEEMLAAHSGTLFSSVASFGVSTPQVPDANVWAVWRSVTGRIHEAGGKWRPAVNAVTGIIRDIFGCRFRPVAFSPEWRTDTAVSLAQQMYESRDFSAMPILADALQDAGCDNPDILDHCRGPGPHVRGCWVCDLVLGKE